MKRFALSSFALMLFVMACGDSTSAPSSSVAPTANVSGTWTGCTTTGNNTPVCSFSLQLSQAGNAVSGTFSEINGSGTVTGSISGGQLALTGFQYTVGPLFNAKVVSLSADVVGNLMSGSVDYSIAFRFPQGEGPGPTNLIASRS